MYRHFDVVDRLLYVGITHTPAARERSHARTSAWHQLSVRRTAHWRASREEAEAEEAKAIAQDEPLFNFPTYDVEDRLRRTYNYLRAQGRLDIWDSYVRGTSAEKLAFAAVV